MTWQERARARMRQLGIKQADLMAALGVTRGAVGHYLSGRRGLDQGQMVALAGALNMSVGELFGEQPQAVDAELLEDVLLLIDEFIEETGAKIPAKFRAQIAANLYGVALTSGKLDAKGAAEKLELVRQVLMRA